MRDDPQYRPSNLCSLRTPSEVRSLFMDSPRQIDIQTVEPRAAFASAKAVPPIYGVSLFRGCKP
jgi:hypothetical protein